MMRAVSEKARHGQTVCRSSHLPASAKAIGNAAGGLITRNFLDYASCW